MKKLAAVALGAALFAGVAVAGLGRHGGLGRPLVLRAAASGSPLLGLDYGPPTRAQLERLDRRTLKTLPGRSLELEEFRGGWSYSPHRSLLAFGNQTSTRVTYSPARIRLVNAHALRKVRDLPLGLIGEVTYAYWAKADRLFALVQSRDDPGNEDDPPVVTERIVAVDPTTGATRASDKLPGRVAALAIADDALVLVLEGSNYGPVRLVVAHGDGRLPSVVLEQVRAGSREVAGEVLREDGVSVAVDRKGGRAYVVSAGDPVAQVDLASLAVDYHTPSQPISFIRRIHDWLEPAAQAKGALEGSWRYATWLGDGRLAVYGRDRSTYPTADGLVERQRPSGLAVIDTHAWTDRVLDPKASSLVVAKGALLCWGQASDGGTQRWTGAGLNVFDRTGSRVFHLYGRRMVSDVQVVGRRAFVGGVGHSGPGYAIVDIRTGKQLRTIRGREMPLVLSGATSPYYG